MFLNNANPAKTDVKKNNMRTGGLLAIAVKVSPKIVAALVKAPVVGKVAKSLFGLKGLGAAGSLGFYSLIFSWQMGVSLVAFILIHEFGHLWAMKKCGLKTRGIYLIPGFGAVAVAAESFRNARNEIFIAILGPLYGLLFIIPMLALYHIIDNPMFAAIASIMSLINLINLFPINPLDGGRITKSLLYSFSASLAFFGMMASFIVAIVISAVTGFWLLLIIAFIGLLETLKDYNLEKALKKSRATFLRAVMFYALFMGVTSDVENWRLIFLFFAIGCLGLYLGWDAVSSTKKEGLPIIVSYPIIIARDIFRAIREVRSLKPSLLQRKDNYDKMPGRQTFRYGLIYLATIIAMIAIIVYTGSIPGVELAKDLLK